MPFTFQSHYANNYAGMIDTILIYAWLHNRNISYSSPKQTLLIMIVL